jgi:hypothetical protein
MDTFIVRLYRRQPSSPQEAVGTVERVGSGERSGFADREELLEHLLAPGESADEPARASAHTAPADAEPPP